MEKERFIEYVFQKTPAEFVDFVDGKNAKDQALKNSIINDYGEAFYYSALNKHLEQTIGEGLAIEKEKDRMWVDMLGSEFHLISLEFYHCKKYLSVKDEKVLKNVSKLVFDYFNKEIENFYHSSTPHFYPGEFNIWYFYNSEIETMYDICNIVFNDKNFTKNDSQAIINLISRIYRKRFNVPVTKSFEDYYVDSPALGIKEFVRDKNRYQKIYGIRLDDAKFIFNIAKKHKDLDISPLENVLIDLPNHEFGKSGKLELAEKHQIILKNYVKDINPKLAPIIYDKIIKEYKSEQISPIILEYFISEAPNLTDEQRNKSEKILMEEHYESYKLFKEEQQKNAEKLEKKKIRKEKFSTLKNQIRFWKKDIQEEKTQEK